MTAHQDKETTASPTRGSPAFLCTAAAGSSNQSTTISKVLSTSISKEGCWGASLFGKSSTIVEQGLFLREWKLENRWLSCTLPVEVRVGKEMRQDVGTLWTFF